MNAIKLASVGTILSLAAFMPNAYAKNWEKKCDTVEKQKICGITQTIFDSDKRPVVNVFIRKVKGQKDPIVFVKVPLGVNLQAGIGLAVDKKEVTQVPYSVCDPAGCNAAFPLSSTIAAKMRKGSKLQVGMLLVNQEVVMTTSLSGFTKALKSL